MPTTRGSFRELWRAGDFPDEPFVQANLSTSAAGVLRGLHLHRRQDDLWIVADGRAFVALVDLRPLLDGSGTAPLVETRELRADEWVVIPTGVAHGFLALEPLAAHLPGHQRVRRLRRARLRLGRPGRRGRLAVRSRGPPTDARSCPSVTAANPPLADLVVRLRADRRLTRTPQTARVPPRPTRRG